MEMSNIISKVLGENEIVLKRFTLSEKYLILKLILSLLNSLVVLSIIYLTLYFTQVYWSEFFALSLEQQREIVGSIFLVILAIFVFIIAPFHFFYYRFYLKISHEYIFSDKRIIVKNGWISTNTISVHYGRITDVTISQGITDRILGIGAISVSTAGNEGHLISLTHVPNPYNLKKELYDLKEEYLKKGYNKIDLPENTGD